MKRSRVLDAGPARSGERLLERVGEGLGVVRVGPQGGLAARLVQRRMRGDHRRDAARERLDDRDPEALEARRVGEGRRAAVEPGELLVGDEAEQPHALGLQRPLLPALEPGERERQLRVPLRAGARRRPRAPAGSCAARASPTPEHVRPAQVGRLALGREDAGRSRGRRRRTRSSGTPSSSTTSPPVKRELTKIRSHVCAACSYFGPCMRSVSGSTHSGKRSGTRSWTVVARRPARCGGYIQSEKWKTSSRPTSRSTGSRPRRLQACRSACGAAACAPRRRARRAPRRSAPPARPGRPERHQLVLAAGRLGQARRPSRGCSSRSRCAGARAG